MTPHYVAHHFQRMWRPASAEAKAPVCRVVDMKYKPGEQCLLVYEWADRLLIGELQWQAEELAASTVMEYAEQLPAPLHMWIYDFAHDPNLPGLAAILDHHLLTKTLKAHCSADLASGDHFTRGDDLIRCRAFPLRYRPGKRCTVRLELTLRHRTTGAYRQEHRFAKLYHDADKAQAVYSEMHLLTAALANAAIPSTLEGPQAQLILARASAHLPELAMVIQEPVTGRPLDLLLSHPERWSERQLHLAAEAVGAAAQALAQLHRLPISTGRRRLPNADLRKLEKRAIKLMPAAPTLGSAMRALAKALSDRLTLYGIEDAPLCIGHGDCKPNQFLLHEGGVALLDFDHCGMSDPAADVGLFIATLRQLHKRMGTKASLRRRLHTDCSSPVQEKWSLYLAERFLADYMRASQMSPQFRQRVAWYTALALLRKAWRGFARSPKSPLPERLIAEGWSCLQPD